MESLRLGLFREFRSERKRHSPQNDAPELSTECAWWNPPPSSSGANVIATAFFDQFLKQRRPEILWVTDPTGIKGVNLLSIWEHHALQIGRVAIAISLSESDSIRELILHSWQREGRLPKKAEWLLDHGGFLILIDATGMEQVVGDTRQIVRELSLNNVVVVAARQLATKLAVECEVICQ